MTKTWKHRGAYSELRACTWLLKQGYEVFRNVSPNGPIDLVAIKDAKILLVDVKTVSDLGARVRSKLPAHQRAMGCVRVYVAKDGTCTW